MSPEQADQELARMIADLRQLDIPVSGKILPRVKINTRARRRLGCCYPRPGGWFEIEVSARLLEDGDKLRQTLAHELLHTCPGCQNHGPAWKAHAARVNAAWGMEITRLAPAGEEDALPLRQEAPKYLLGCTACGRLFPRSRLSKAVKQPWRYRCPCGGKLKRLPAEQINIYNLPGIGYNKKND